MSDEWNIHDKIKQVAYYHVFLIRFEIDYIAYMAGTLASA